MEDLSPHLIEQGVIAEINKELGNDTDNYWKPVKKLLSDLWKNIIVCNATFFILLTMLVLILLYRYRYVKNKKINEIEIKPISTPVISTPVISTPSDELSESIANDLVKNINQDVRGYPQYISSPYQSKYIRKSIYY